MQYLRADTITEVTIGPAVAVGDGFTPVTTLTIAGADEAEIIKHGATTTTAIAGTLAAITGADGYYALDLSATDTNTEGRLTLLINDDSLILPIRHEFMVVNTNVFDSLFAAAATDYLQVDTFQIAGTTQDAIDLADFAAAGYDPATNKVQGVVLTDTTTAVTNGVTLAAGAVTNASLAGNMEIVFETDFATNYNQTDNAWVTNGTSFIGTGWNVGKTGYSLTQAFPANFADMSITVTTGLVDITQAAADKAWSTATRVLTAGTNLNDIAAGDVWAVDATTQQTQGTFGQAIGDPALDTTSIYQSVVTDAAGDNVSIDVAAVKAETALIVADTNELQTDWADAGRLDAILDARAAQTTADAIEADTQNIQSRLPTSLIGGRMDSDVEAINNSTTAAIQLALSAAQIENGACEGTPSTTVIQTDLAETQDDIYIGRTVIFTSGNARGEATDITDYAGATGTITVTALANAPTAADTFILI